VVAGKTDRGAGVSMFVVDADAPGVTTRRLNTVGRHILGTYDVFYDDVFVPEDARLGEEGTGWNVVNQGLVKERLFGCSAYIGSLSTVLDLGVTYARERVQFGQSIGKFQAVSHPLADIYADLQAGRLLVYATASKMARGADARTDVAAAKLFVTEAYQKATNLVMQIHGGYGYMLEFDIQRYWRDAKVV
jgi:alkylation response protein AidB-like acyl-CoA dehydrogenase